MAPVKPWTAAEDAELVRLYPLHSNTEIGVMIGRTEPAILNRAHKLGLKKPAGHTNAGCFKPGQTSWNAGMRGLDIGGKATRFKKGQMPHNTADVGEYRITKDNTLQRKISSASGNNSVRWRGVHELVWIAAHGPMPAGHICVFKRGMKTVVLEEITADKVECISFAENMRRNSVHNLPKPIAQLVQLRGALVRKINHTHKEVTA
jgi:hypothetical protein